MKTHTVVFGNIETILSNFFYYFNKLVKIWNTCWFIQCLYWKTVNDRTAITRICFSCFCRMFVCMIQIYIFPQFRLSENWNILEFYILFVKFCLKICRILNLILNERIYTWLLLRYFAEFFLLKLNISNKISKFWKYIKLYSNAFKIFRQLR